MAKKKQNEVSAIRRPNEKRARVAPASTRAKPSPGDAADLARELAIDSLFNFWHAAIWKSIKDRSHRKPSEERISAEFSALRADKFAFFKPVFQMLRDEESHLGKPYVEWTVDERRYVGLWIARVLDGERSELVRGRGQRKKPEKKQAQGLINSAITSMADRGKLKRVQMKELRRMLLFAAAGGKIGKFARQEGMVHDFEAAKKRMRNVVIDSVNVGGFRSNAKVVQGFIEARGLDPQLKARFKQYLSRNKEKIENILRESLDPSLGKSRP